MVNLFYGKRSQVSVNLSANLTQWRLICAGWYPVEWRDFYMGDMFCSLTYSMGVSRSLSVNHYQTNTPRTSSCSSACMPMIGLTQPNATPRIPDSSAFSLLFPVYGAQYSAFDVTTTPATLSHICSIWANTWQRSFSI